MQLENLKNYFRMVIEAFVYLEKRLKEVDDFRQKFDGSNTGGGVTVLSGNGCERRQVTFDV